MDKRFITPLSWLLGVAFLVAIVLFSRPQDFISTIASVGVRGLLQWVLLTLVARVVLAETTVAPLKVLGFDMRRSDAFWIGWIRTFANQILPLAGIAAYAHAVRDRVGISWSELASLVTPQFFLAATALGIVGLLATAVNFEALGMLAYALTGVYFGVVFFSIAVATGAGWLIESLPERLSSRALKTSAALHRFGQRRNLIARLVMYHSIVILLRGCRLWILFMAAGAGPEWHEMLLIAAIAESTLLIQLTPGGLGLREGAVLGAASLVGIAAPVAISVALIDRLLVVAITTMLALPAFRIFRGNRST
jgi:uncharacterized protein (TIRG00374 family)